MRMWTYTSCLVYCLVIKTYFAVRRTTYLYLSHLPETNTHCRTICRPFHDSSRSWSGAMTAKALTSQKRLYPPAIFSTKFLYQPSCSPHTDVIPARMPWLSSSSAVELRTPILYTRGCRSWRWGRVYRNPWQHRHQPARASIDTPKNPRRRKSTVCTRESI